MDSEYKLQKNKIILYNIQWFKKTFLKNLEYKKIKVIYTNYNGINAVMSIFGWIFIFEKYNRNFILTLEKDEDDYIGDNIDYVSSRVNIYDYSTGIKFNFFRLNEDKIELDITIEKIENLLDEYYENGFFTISYNGKNKIDINKFEKINN